MHMVVATLCHMSEEVASNLEMFNALRALNTKKLVKDDSKVLDHIRRVQSKESTQYLLRSCRNCLLYVLI